MKLSKLTISITCLVSLLTVSGCSSMEWTDQEFIDKWNQSCNPDNKAPYKRYCDCQLDRLKTKYPSRQEFADLPEAKGDEMIKEARQACLNWDMDILKDAYMKDCNSDGSKLSYCTCQHKGLASKFPLAEQFSKLSKDEQASNEQEIAESCLNWDVMGEDLVRKLKMDKSTDKIAECLVDNLKEKFETFGDFAEAEDDGMLQSVVTCSSQAKEKEDAANAEAPPEEDENAEEEE